MNNLRAFYIASFIVSMVFMQELHAQNPGTLLSVAQQNEHASVRVLESLNREKSSGRAISAHLIKIRAGKALLTKREFLIELIPGELWSAKTAGYTVHEGGDITWVGRLNNDSELQVLTMGDEGIIGRLDKGGRAFYLNTAIDGFQIVSELNKNWATGEENDVFNDAASESRDLSGLSNAFKSRPALDHIEVLVVYTSAASTGISSTITNSIEVANVAVNASAGADGSIGLAFKKQVNIAENANLQTVMTDLINDQSIKDLRDAAGADIVGLIVNTADGCGLASRIGATSTDGYFIVKKSCSSAQWSFGHEIGHLLGARATRPCKRSCEQPICSRARRD